ncbi:major facilitator superfamily protein [Wolffia australiana]
MKSFPLSAWAAMAGALAVKEGSRPPWVGLGAAVWVQLAAGSAFAFPLYSPSLKSVLGFSQQQLTILGVANDIGENVGILPGIASNRFPPWTVLLVGALCGFLGFGVLYLAVSQTLHNIPYWLLWVALVVATNSSAWLGTAVLVTNMRNFPLSRGAVAGILKGYVGLSAAVYAQVYSGLLQSSSAKLLLLFSLGIPTISISLMYLVRPCVPSKQEDSSERGHFLFVQIASVLLGLYLLSTAAIDDLTAVPRWVSAAFVGGMVALLLAPLAVPLKLTLEKKNKKEEVIEVVAEENSLSEEPLLVAEEEEEATEVSLLLAEGEGAVRRKRRRRPHRGEDFRFREALVKADFWLLFVAYFLGVGSGVTVLNNLAQIGASAGEDDTTILLSLFSFCNFLGRLLGGTISEHFARTRMLPRTAWMAVTQAVMVVAHVLFALSLRGGLYVATGLLGVCYGVQFSVMIPTASELFGLKNFGIIYNFMILGNPLGALLFSGFLAGYVYDREVAAQLGDDTCVGARCFRLTFEVLACVCLLGSAVSAVLTARTRSVYQALYAGGSFRLAPGGTLH